MPFSFFLFFFGNYFYWLPGEIPPYQPNQYPYCEKGGWVVPRGKFIILQNRHVLITGNQWQPEHRVKSFSQKKVQVKSIFTFATAGC